MTDSILVTGGAGFIGSHVVDLLLERGHNVRVLDSLVPQVHGKDQARPAYLGSDVELIQGDVRDRRAVKRALEGQTMLCYQAASVGVGQSMYDIESYVSNNTLGAAVVLDVLANERHSVRKIVVASSMSIYGEGKYRCPRYMDSSHAEYFAPRVRTRKQLERHDWEPRCPNCGTPGESVPCDEDKSLYPTSVYAVTKRDHEELFLSVGAAYGIPVVALRYFNTYGERQSLSNPYTGVAAIFASQLLSGNPPVIFEDGAQSRDFTHVSDVARANVLALEGDGANHHAVNVGTGQRTTLLMLVELLRARLDPEHRIQPTITGRFREGDIRHCFASVDTAKKLLGYEPNVRFDAGVDRLVSWAKEQQVRDDTANAFAELQKNRLIR